MPGLRKISLLTSILEDDQGRKLAYLPNFSHPRILLEEASVRKLKFFSLAEIVTFISATGIGTYLYGAGGFTLFLLTAIIVAQSLKFYVFRALPVARDIAPAWHQAASKLPFGALIAGLIIGFLFVAMAIFGFVDGIFDWPLATITGMFGLGLIFIYTAYLRFKWRHRKDEMVPGALNMDMGRQSLRRLSEQRFWWTVVFLLFQTIIPLVLSWTEPADYIRTNLIATLLSLVGVIAIVRFVLMTAGKVRYGRVVLTTIVAGCGFKILTLPILIGLRPAIPIILGAWWAELFFWFVYGSLFWLFAFYRNRYFFPKNEDAAAPA